MNNATYKGWRVYDYYQWLIEKVNAPIAEDHTLLLNELHNIPFRWKIERDENRAKDGIDLRYIFLEENGYADRDPYYSFTVDESIDCSVLEMLIALAERFSKDVVGESYINTKEWFWIMIKNLDLLECTDERYSTDYVRQQVSIFLDRKYTKHGDGGMFPLNEVKGDQRKMEIWYQISQWFNENRWNAKSCI